MVEAVPALLESAMIYVTVCKNTILSNLKRRRNDPPIRVSRGKHGRPRRYHRLTLQGPVTICYEPTSPLPWGARVWIEAPEVK